MASRKSNRKTRARGKAARGSKRSGRAPKAAARARRKQRRAPQTLRLRSFGPGFTVKDLDRSVSFYTGALGFTVGERWTQDGKLTGVMLKAGACQLGLSQDDWAMGRDRKKGQGVRVWCQTVQDVDALAARVKAAGVRLTEEPKDQPWGARSFSVDDPDGYHLTIFRERKARS